MINWIHADDKYPQQESNNLNSTINQTNHNIHIVFFSFLLLPIVILLLLFCHFLVSSNHETPISFPLLLTTCILFSNPVSAYTWDALLLPTKAVPLRMSLYFICPLWFISMSSNKITSCFWKKNNQSYCLVFFYY